MKEENIDGVLLSAARNGNQDAFILLFERYRIPIYRFLYRFLGSERLAEDITHDCFLELVRNRAESNFSQDSLLIRLYAIARKLAIDQPDNIEDKPRHTDEEAVETVKQSIHSLPPLERETLILFEYEGLSVAEIARIVKADAETVELRLSEARLKLQAALVRNSDTGNL